MSEQEQVTILVMDGDVCDCGGLFDYWGLCESCGSDGVEWYEEDVDDWDMGDYDEGWDIYY